MGSCCSKDASILPSNRVDSDIDLPTTKKVSAWFSVQNVCTSFLEVKEIGSSQDVIQVHFAGIDLPLNEPSDDIPDSIRNKEILCSRITRKHLEDFFSFFEKKVFCLFVPRTDGTLAAQLYVRYHVNHTVHEMISVQRFLTHYKLAKKDPGFWMQSELDEILATEHRNLTQEYFEAVN